MKIITGKTATEHVNSEDDRGLYAGIFGSGSYILNTGTKFQTSIESSTTIRINSGDLVHQGCHARIPYDEYDEVTIDAGTTGYKRIDLIVARYERNAGLESMSLVAIKGQPAVSDPVAPDYNNGNILEGASISDCPLYKVTLDGVNIISIERPLSPIDFLEYGFEDIKFYINNILSRLYEAEMELDALKPKYFDIDVDNDDRGGGHYFEYADEYSDLSKIIGISLISKDTENIGPHYQYYDDIDADIGIHSIEYDPTSFEGKNVFISAKEGGLLSGYYYRVFYLA